MHASRLGPLWLVEAACWGGVEACRGIVRQFEEAREMQYYISRMQPRGSLCKDLQRKRRKLGLKSLTNILVVAPKPAGGTH
jgi:hypothetical protein